MFIIEGNNNKKAKRPNFRKGSKSHSPSQTNGKAKVEINSEITIPKLQNLAQRYVGVTDPHGFLTDLRIALGIPDSHGASKYGIVSIPKEDGNILQASLRVTNHQANANTYIDHNANYEYNLSIVVRRKQRKNTFIPNDNVILDEYVYYGTKMQDIENPLSQIVNGIIIFLQSGEYKDTTGIAFKNQSVKSKDRVPQNISINKDGNWVPANGQCADYVSESIDNKQHKTRYNMKRTIRLSESDLHMIIEECVNRVLTESADMDDVVTNDELQEGFGNWVRAGVDALSNTGAYAQGPSKSKLCNFVDNVGRRKQYYDDIDTTEKAGKYGLRDAPQAQMARSRNMTYRAPGDNREVSDVRRTRAHQMMVNGKEAQQRVDRRRSTREYDQRHGTNHYQERYGH